METKEEIIRYLKENNWPFVDNEFDFRIKCMKCHKEASILFDFEIGKYACENKNCDVMDEIINFLPKKTSDDLNLSGLIISTCQELLNYEIQPEFFVINPLIPKEAITNISADSGKGKSLFALILAYHIASGTPLFGKYDVEQGAVLIIDQEQNKNTIVSRFKKIVSVDIPINYTIDQRFVITDEDNLDDLKSIINSGYKVVIFDTFVEILTGNENDSGEMKIVNSKLLELIRSTKVTVIYLHHHRKLSKGDKLSQASSRGSTEIIAKVSSHLLLDSKNYKDEFDNNVLEMTISQEKARSSSRLDGKISFKVINDQSDNTIKWEYLGEVEDKEKKVEEAKAHIMELLQTEPGVTVRDLEEKTKIGNSNIRAALKELVSENKLDVGRQGRAKYYFLTNS